MAFLSGIRKVFIPAPAKVNLFLSILGKRDDGFHELLTILAKLKLHDLISLEFNEKDNVTEISCPGFPEIENSQNLAVRIVDLWRLATGINRGVRIVIDKHIPMEAGLGGGSSDAVATLIGLNSLVEKKLKPEELLEIASAIGSDCPSFLIPGVCVASGRGEVAREGRVSSLNSVSGKRLLLFKPNCGFSTAEIYGNLEASVFSFSNREDAVKKMTDWEVGEGILRTLMQNDLEEPVLKKYLFMEAMFEELKEKFKLSPMLCGSGSCCFSLIPETFDINPVRRHIEKSWGEKVFITETQFV
jgi:4-diphosphocytidyl-2-C-methyl-D-erythritol kinase